MESNYLRPLQLIENFSFYNGNMVDNSLDYIAEKHNKPKLLEKLENEMKIDFPQPKFQHKKRSEGNGKENLEQIGIYNCKLLSAFERIEDNSHIKASKSFNN